MEQIQSLNLITVAQYVLTMVICAGITQAIKQTKIPNGVMPFVAGASGALIGVGAVLATGGGNVAAGAMVGLAAGLTASGVYSGVKGTAGAVTGAQAAKVAAEQAAADKQEAETKQRIGVAVDAAVKEALAKQAQTDSPVDSAEITQEEAK